MSIGTAIGNGISPVFLRPKGAQVPLLLDTFSATAAYSTRKLRNAQTLCCLLRRDSDNAELDFGFDGNGNLNTSAITSWLAGANGYIKTWYDQSGNGNNITQTTQANQPLYVASAQNSHPGLRFDGGNDFLRMAANFSASVSQPFTVFLVMKQISWTNNDFIFDGRTANDDVLRQGPTSPNINLFSAVTIGQNLGALAVGTYGILRCKFLAAAPELELNNTTQVAGTIGGNSMTGVTLGTRGDGSTLFCANIEMTEWIMFSSFTEADIWANMNGYWNVF